MESWNFESGQPPLPPPHFEKSGYAPAKDKTKKGSLQLETFITEIAQSRMWSIFVQDSTYFIVIQ